MKQLLLIVIALGLTACASKEFKKGAYEDPTKINLLSDDFSESDAQVISEATINQLIKPDSNGQICPAFTSTSAKPFVVIDRIENRTEEHIDLKMMTSSVRNALVKSGRVRFINNEARKEIDTEYTYNSSGAVEDGSKKVRGKQKGADYMLFGSLFTVVQEVGGNKTVYYKFNTELTHTETSEIVCTTEQQIRKTYKKKR